MKVSIALLCFHIALAAITFKHQQVTNFVNAFLQQNEKTLFPSRLRTLFSEHPGTSQWLRREVEPARHGRQYHLQPRHPRQPGHDHRRPVYRRLPAVDHRRHYPVRQHLRSHGWHCVHPVCQRRHLAERNRR